MKGRGYDFFKRVVDIAVSFFLLALLAPAIALISVLIKVDSRGPVFYTQDRVGLDGRVFKLIKFRSMVRDAENGTGPVIAEPDDARTTRLGRFIRLRNIDEIPQLINVLKGDMSLVGPRPERPFFHDKFASQVDGWTERLSVRPGLTGLSQLKYGYMSDPKVKLSYDVEYLRGMSLFFDLRIMAETAWLLFKKFFGVRV